MHALTVNQISFNYRDGIPTLRDVSFHVEKGEFFSLAGPNGSGKSTLLRLLDRIYVPRSGTILLDNKNLTEYPRSELARRIAFVPQDTAVQFPFTVLELVLMGRSPHSRGAMFESEHDRTVALEMLERTDTGHLAHHPVTMLSGGERQRVVIARALAQQPEILLLDEPNAHLDIAHQLEIFTIIKKLNEESGLTVVSVSHDLNLAGAYSNRIGMLVCGSLAALGTPGDVLTEANIRSVFQTNVLVDRHPATQSPRVTLLTSQ
ncbi:ABC transporter ATP-binding protein [Sphingobacteriales bacterium CHB3]|nr:ABC transporter ATP-binding protein [Sphingobacteriales bacterium CHB3]